jgi:hypothetical protein
MATVESATLKTPQRVRGIPVIGSALAMVKDPAKFFVDCYRKYGPVFRIQILSNTYTVLAGAETANFMGTRQGRDSLRSKEFWQGLVDEWRARRTLTSEDGKCIRDCAEVQMTLTLARLFHQLDLGLESPGYVLQRKTLPTPDPA